MDQQGNVKQQIMEYYNSVGWKSLDEGLFHNASREDLRPVARDYIHRCRMRVARHISARGRFLLDAGSGPIQYPEYVEYSAGYHWRVCLDISRLALVGARERIGDHGLMVLGDLANLPFRNGGLDAAVSLHAVHHIPGDEQLRAFSELQRVLQPGGTAVVVHSWGELAPIQRLMRYPIRWTIALKSWIVRLIRRQPDAAKPAEGTQAQADQLTSPTFRHDYRWVRKNLGSFPGFKLRIWRTISTRFSQAFITRHFFGKFFLGILYALEEMAPKFFARFGQYPMIIFSGTEAPESHSNEG